MLLSEAIKGMDKVADYINEMQRIHDLYSPLFNKLMSQSQHEKVKAILYVISPYTLKLPWYDVIM